MKMSLLPFLGVLFLLPCGLLPAEPVNTVDKKLENVPRFQRDRCTRVLRLAAIEKYGGDPTTEGVVEEALRFLKSTQNKDGSWFQLNQDGSWVNDRKVPLTALALLCFLGHGETAQSDEFGFTVLNGLTFLIESAVKNRGKLADDFRNAKWPYDHAIAMSALTEAYCLCERGFGEKLPNLRRAVEVGGQFLINSQHKGGGWDYHYSEDSARGGDTSITGWHLLALKRLKLSGLEFTNLRKCYKKGTDYMERMQAASGAIGYSSPSGLHFDGTTLAAVGSLGIQIWEGPGDRVVRKSVKFIDQNLKFAWDTPDSDLYGQLFAASLMRDQEAKYWKRYHDKVFPEVLSNQASDGSFHVINRGKRKGMQGMNAFYADDGDYGKHYRTCLATLILQTYYNSLISPAEASSRSK